MLRSICAAGLVVAATVAAGACGSGGSHHTSSGEGGSGAGHPSCDRSGDCGDERSPYVGCVACAIDGPCKQPVQACLLLPECTALISCIEACTEPGCVDDCSEFHGLGREPLDAWLSCVYCKQCAIDCRTDLSECPEPPAK